MEEPCAGIFALPDVQDAVFPSFCPADLFRFSLVSKTWQAMVEPFLFGIISLGIPSQTSATWLLTGDTQYPTILANAHWIRTLAIDNPRMLQALVDTEQCTQLRHLHTVVAPNDHLTAMSVVDLLWTNPRLQSFYWRSEGQEFGYDHIFHMAPALAQTSFRTLQKLEFENMHLCGGLEQVFRTCQQLEELSLVKCQMRLDCFSRMLSFGECSDSNGDHIEDNNNVKVFEKLKRLTWRRNQTIEPQEMPLENEMLLGPHPFMVLLISTTGRLTVFDVEGEQAVDDEVSDLVINTGAFATVECLTVGGLFRTDAQLKQVLGATRPLKKLHLSHMGGLHLYSRNIDILYEPRHKNTLTEIELNKMKVSSLALHLILVHCSKLISFSAPDKECAIKAVDMEQDIAEALARGDEQGGRWTCHDLKRLRLNFSCRPSSDGGSSKLSLEQQDRLVTETVKSSRVVFEQLSKLKRLQSWETSFWPSMGSTFRGESECWDPVLEHWKLLGECANLKTLAVQWGFPDRLMATVQEWSRQRWKGEGYSVVIKA